MLPSAKFGVESGITFFSHTSRPSKMGSSSENVFHASPTHRIFVGFHMRTSRRGIFYLWWPHFVFWEAVKHSSLIVTITLASAPSAYQQHRVFSFPAQARSARATTVLERHSLLSFLLLRVEKIPFFPASTNLKH